MKQILYLLICFLAYHANAQKANLCQFMVTPAQFNPAFAGIFPATFRISANYKSQWASEISPYQIKAATVEAGMANKDGKGYNGVALIWMSDRAGDTRTGTNQLTALFSKAFYLGPNDLISAGVLLGMDQHVSDHQMLTWDSQYDGTGYNPSFGTPENMLSVKPYFNVGAGIAYSYDRPESYMKANNQLKIRTGIAVSYLNMPNRSLLVDYVDRLSPSWLASGDFIIPLRNSNWSYRPVFMYQWIQREQYASAGLLMGYRFRDGSVYTGKLALLNFYYGVLYRAYQGPSVQLIAELGRFEFSVGYDFPISPLAKYVGIQGGFEFSFRTLFIRGDRKKR